MSQVHVPSQSIEDALMLQMTGNSTNTASGDFYLFEVSDDSLFEVILSSGTNITIDPSDNVIVLDKGLYQLNFSAGVRSYLNAETYGTGQTTLQISTDPTFSGVDVVNDQQNKWFGTGNSSHTSVFFDMNNPALINVTQDQTPLAFQIRLTTENAVDFVISGSDVFPITVIHLVRLTQY